ncbi:MAG TPA: phosphate ABC transporter permease subunit PstC [Terriglobales bacterium]|nr:phosphate ABC transporter permease subunit PstC [Terriglobales bacterium]HUL17410.1 phosphate ABC transporter permease subunit PstC [Terriglobales bacterium]
MNGSDAAVRTEMGPVSEEPKSLGRTWRLSGDFFFHKAAVLGAFIAAAALFATVIAIAYDSRLSIQTFGIWKFLKSSDWDPVTQTFGSFPFIVGTLVSSTIAMVLGVPISFGIAVFIAEIAPAWIKRPVAGAIELLAAIPSIVYGLWGLLVFAPVFAKAEPWINNNIGAIPGIGLLFQGPPMGIGMLTAGIVLAIMVLPYISSIMRDVFMVVPSSLRESAYAMGATTWEVAWDIILPYTRSAVIGGIFLGLGRALGETMAVTFVIGNSNVLSTSLLMPGASIPSVLANEFTEATTPLYVSSLIYLGLILIAVTLVVRFLAVLLIRRLGRKEGAKT